MSIIGGKYLSVCVFFNKDLRINCIHLLYSNDAFPEEYLQKLLHYQERYVGRNLITGQEHFQTVANRSPNAELFLEKYDHLDSKK